MRYSLVFLLTFNSGCVIKLILFFYQPVPLQIAGGYRMTHAHHLQHPDIQDDMWSKIDEIIAANRHIAGSVIGVLRECQDVVGYLPIDLQDLL